MATATAGIGRYLWILRWPIALTVFNSLLSAIVFDWPMGDVGYNVARIGIWVYAAWLLVRSGITNLWLISLGGFLLLFLDHPVVRGGGFLVGGETMAFYGVLISFAMFVAVPMLLMALAGYIFRRRLRNVAI